MTEHTENNELLVDIKDRVLTLTLNKPEKRNLLTLSMLDQITNQLNNLVKENSVRCVVIRGFGEKAFSSGYDISAIGENDMMREYENNHPLISCMKAIERFPYPVIAMMNGHAFGAGLELAVTCDIRICAANAKLGIPPVKLGVVYTYSGIRKFLNLIGPGYTKELFLTGNPVDAKKAEKIGLVNYVVSEEEIEEFTYNFAEEISKNAPLSLNVMKEMINVWERNQTLSKQDEDLIKSLIQNVQNSDDYKEGQRAFEEKRNPVFKGK